MEKARIVHSFPITKRPSCPPVGKIEQVSMPAEAGKQTVTEVAVKDEKEKVVALESLVVQIAKSMVSEGKYCFVQSKLKKEPDIGKFQDNIVKLKENDCDFRGYCKERLRKYLNPTVLAQIKENDQEEIEIDGITVKKYELEAAKRNGFRLSRELKDLIDELHVIKGFTFQESDFMPKSNEIPCLNGIIYTAKKQFISYNKITIKDIRVSKTVNAEFKSQYIYQGFPPKFERLLRRATYNPRLTDDQNNNRYESILDILAYSLIDGNPLRLMFIFKGDSGSGKSTLRYIMNTLFGDFAVSLNSQSIMRHSQATPERRPDWVKAEGAKWIDISELDERQVLDAKIIKTITSDGDTLSIRSKSSGELQDVAITGKIYVFTNFMPKVLKTDDALNNRVKVIDLYNSLSPDEIDHGLKQELTTLENRSRIFSCLLYRVAAFFKSQPLHINIDPSFEGWLYYQESEQKSTVKSLKSIQNDSFDQFVDGVLLVRNRDLYTPAFEYQYNGQDIWQVYMVFGHYHLQLPPESLLGRTSFLMKLSKVLREFMNPSEFKIKHNNGIFWKGIWIPNEFIQWPLIQPIDGGYNQTPIHTEVIQNDADELSMEFVRLYGNR